jgi:hypothetical protein
MLKYVFLDVDDVIVSEQYIENVSYGYAIDPKCEDRLGRILDATGASIVLISSKRKATVEDTRIDMTEIGFKYSDKIVGVTIRAYHYLDPKYKIHLSIPRGVEVKQWIDTHIHSDNGKNFERKIFGEDWTAVILDDDTDFLLEQAMYYINIPKYYGLQDIHVNQAIAILNRI